MARQNHWLILDLIGQQSNRDGIGAKIWLTLENGQTQLRDVHSGDSLGAGSDLAAHFGLGPFDRAAEIKIVWPSGIQQTLLDVPANQRLVVTEPTE